MLKKILSCLIGNGVGLALFYFMYKFGISYVDKCVVSKYGILCFGIIMLHIILSDYKFLKGTKV